MKAPEPQQLSRHGIGGSEVAAVCGLSPYRGPMDVWLDKVGLGEPFEGNEATRWGHALEPLIRARYQAEHGVEIFVPPDSMFHHHYHYARATPDGIVVERGGEWRSLVQIKTVGPRSIKRWEDGQVPVEYQAQVQWEMFVTGLDKCDIAALLGGQEYTERRIAFDDDAVQSMLEIVVEFWTRYVVPKKEPPVDSSEAWRRHLEGKMRNVDTQAMVVADREIDLLAKQLREVKRDIAALEEREAELRNHICQYLADRNASALQTSEGTITWKATKPRATLDKDTLIKHLAGVLAHTLKQTTEQVLAPAQALYTREGQPSMRFAVPRNWSEQ